MSAAAIAKLLSRTIRFENYKKS